MDNIWDNIEKPLEDGKFKKLDFKNPLMLMAIVDPVIRERHIVHGKPFTLYKWQTEINEMFGDVTPTAIHPFKYCLCAANGSGKDAFVIAPFALWFAVCKVRSKVIITSSSASQLNTQTEHYIRSLANKINEWYKVASGRNEDILKIRQHHITCLLSGSEIFMFVTDEAGKAEGHHPTEPGCEMAIIINEGKSVPEEIYEALGRCNGYNYWIEVSSPGQKGGRFYKHFNNLPENRKRRVTYFDCLNHLAESDFEDDRREYGEWSAYFRSKHLALFTNLDGKYVVNQQRLEELIVKIKNKSIRQILQTRPLRVGIDLALSQNGDESVISIWRGNVQVDEKRFKIQDAIMLAAAISVHLEKFVSKGHNFIFADDGGVGRAVIDILRSKGWNINRVLNNHASRNKKAFKNKGAQYWYKFARLIEEQLLIFKDPDNNKELINQIAGRKYKDGNAVGDKLQLESKKDMMADGFKSPDRADAAVLAFADCDIKEFLDANEATDSVVPDTDFKQIALDEFKYLYRHDREKLFGDNTPKKRVHGSLDVLLSKKRNQDNLWRTQHNLTRQFRELHLN